jgi:hypothetical protein
MEKVQNPSNSVSSVQHTPLSESFQVYQFANDIQIRMLQNNLPQKMQRKILNSIKHMEF